MSQPTHQVLVRFTPAQVRRLDELKQVLHCSRTSLILRAIDQFIADNVDAEQRAVVNEAHEEALRYLERLPYLEALRASQAASQKLPF